MLSQQQRITMTAGHSVDLVRPGVRGLGTMKREMNGFERFMLWFLIGWLLTVTAVMVADHVAPPKAHGTECHGCVAV